MKGRSRRMHFGDKEKREKKNVRRGEKKKERRKRKKKSKSKSNVVTGWTWHKNTYMYIARGKTDKKLIMK